MYEKMVQRSSWERKRKQIMMAEGLIEEDEEIMSSTIPKGIRSVKKLFSGRITEGMYGMYMTFITVFFGIVAAYHQVSRDIFVKHATAFLIVWLVNLTIGLWVLT